MAAAADSFFTRYNAPPALENLQETEYSYQIIPFNKILRDKNSLLAMHLQSIKYYKHEQFNDIFIKLIKEMWKECGSFTHNKSRVNTKEPTLLNLANFMYGKSIQTILKMPFNPIYANFFIVYIDNGKNNQNTNSNTLDNFYLVRKTVYGGEDPSLRDFINQINTRMTQRMRTLPLTKSVLTNDSEFQSKNGRSIGRNPQLMGHMRGFLGNYGGKRTTRHTKRKTHKKQKSRRQRK